MLRLAIGSGMSRAAAGRLRSNLCVRYTRPHDDLDLPTLARPPLAVARPPLTVTRRPLRLLGAGTRGLQAARGTVAQAHPGVELLTGESGGKILHPKLARGFGV